MKHLVAIAFAISLGWPAFRPAPAAAQDAAAPFIHGAEVRVGAKKWKEAERFLKEEALTQYPDSPELWYWLGVVYAQGTNRNTEEAAKAFAKANELAGPEETAFKEKIDTAVKAIWAPLVNMAAKAADAGDYPKAEAMLKQATQINPQGAEAWINLGTVYLKQNKNAEAIEAYKKAIELQPDNETLTYNLGITYHQLAREARQKGDSAKSGEYYKLAESTYKAYLAKKPDDTGIINNLAALYQEQGNEAKMREALGEVAESGSATAQDLYNAGLAALKGKEYAKAEESFRKAMQAADASTPEGKQVLSFSRENLGLTLIQLKKYDEAIQVLQEQLASKPDPAAEATAHEYLGFAYREAGRKDEAAAEFAKAEEMKKAGAADASAPQ
jgi:tetratricopeptide (TPR) repeat protein